MKIGIVSKESHAKTHYAALTRKGYEVSLLGGNPNEIPPTIDVLVIRDASCSTHSRLGGLQWGRDTGKTVIMQNGLSGILRELDDLRNEAPPPEADVPQNRFSDLDAIVAEARNLGRGIAHVAARYEMDTGDLVRDLRAAGLYQNAIVNLTPPSEDVATAAKTYLDILLEERPDDSFEEYVDAIAPLMEDSIDSKEIARILDPFPAPYPKEKWTKAVSENRLRKETLLGKKFAANIEARIFEDLGTELERQRYTSESDLSWSGEMIDTLRAVGRNPLRVLVVLASCAPMVLNRKMIASIYKELFGAGMDMRNADAVAWVFETDIAFQVPEAPKPRKPRRGLVQISGEPPRPTTNPNLVEVPAPVETPPSRPPLETIGVLSPADPGTIPPSTDVAHLQAEILALREEIELLRLRVSTSDSDEVRRLRGEVRDLKAAYASTRLNSAITFDEILTSVVASGAVLQIVPKNQE